MRAASASPPLPERDFVLLSSAFVYARKRDCPGRSRCCCPWRAPRYRNRDIPITRDQARLRTWPASLRAGAAEATVHGPRQPGALVRRVAGPALGDARAHRFGREGPASIRLQRPDAGVALALLAVLRGNALSNAKREGRREVKAGRRALADPLSRRRRSTSSLVRSRWCRSDMAPRGSQRPESR